MGDASEDRLIIIRRYGYLYHYRYHRYHHYYRHHRYLAENPPPAPPSSPLPTIGITDTTGITATTIERTTDTIDIGITDTDATELLAMRKSPCRASESLSSTRIASVIT